MVNSRSLQELILPVRKRMIEFIAVAEMELGVTMLVTSTFRDGEAQDELYRIGRRGVPGEKIVTNAKAGESWHNWRCAMDVVPLKNGVLQYDNAPLIAQVGAIAKRLGLTWGGDWNGDGKQDKADWDRVHFQWTGGLTLADLKAGKQIPET